MCLSVGFRWKRCSASLRSCCVPGHLTRTRLHTQTPGRGPAAGRSEVPCHWGPGLGTLLCFWPLLRVVTRAAVLPFHSQLSIWQFDISEVTLVTSVLPFSLLLFKIESFLFAVKQAHSPGRANISVLQKSEFPMP